ncbi:MAG: NAD-dependent deacetylase, partial [Deltaproteobacteria bacterium]|nr:NAD-dependent deacetylase [Deltaproteobacteria bacterium]
AVISFGQNLVAEDLEQAFSAAQACDLFVAIGSSLVVGPINQMFSLAKQAGARTAILTRSATDYDGLADWKISDPLDEVLPALWANLSGGTTGGRA